MDSDFLTQVQNSQTKIKNAEEIIAKEQEKLFRLVQSKGYKLYGNLYIHPDYWEEYIQHTWRGNYPEGVVIKY